MMISKANNHSGFTLIEVLVALAIVTVAYVALYGAIAQMVYATTLMQDKTIASWIAYDQITELRVSGEFPGASEKSDDLEMAGRRWLYTIEIRATDSDDLRQVVVKVATETEPDNFLGLATGALPRNQRGKDGPPSEDPNRNLQ